MDEEWEEGEGREMDEWIWRGGGKEVKVKMN